MQAFRETCGEIFITPNNAQAMFLTSLQSLFSDGIVNWGRIVALLAFSGSLAAQCIEKEMPFLVNQVVDWTAAYISTHLASWINENGGWVSRLSGVKWLNCCNVELSAGDLLQTAEYLESIPTVNTVQILLRMQHCS